MIQKAIQYIMGFRDVETIEHDNVKYSSRQLVKFPTLNPDYVSTKSLASIVDLVISELNHSRIEGLKVIIQVEGPKKVKVFTSLGDNLERLGLYEAIAEVPTLQLNTFIELEAMNIHLKSCFVPAEQMEGLISILGNVREEAVKTSSDDGFSQSVVAKTGIATMSNVTIPPIVKLTPYRTFLEVDQPEGEFLLRLQNGPKVALFEADGGAWKLKARQRIKMYFQYNMELQSLIKADRVVVLE